MTDDLRHRYAELITAWSEPGTRLARLSELLAVRDEELERLRRWERIASKDNTQLREEVTRLRINAEKDVCSGCMQREEQRDRWMEATRQNGVKYEAAKQRWYEAKDQAEAAEAAIARVRDLADFLCAEPHPTHDHLCPDDVSKRLLAALDDTAGA